MHDNMDITALLIELFARNGDRPKYLALADAVDQAFRERKLAPGAALPPQRDLAQALGVTLGTVSRAYAEAATRGLVEAAVGRGTFIRAHRPDVDVMPPDAAEGDGTSGISYPAFSSPAQDSRSGKEQAGACSHVLNLGFIAPFEHLNPSLSQGLRNLTEHDAASLDALQRYRRPGGMLRHREAGAAWAMRYGLAVRSEELLICAGSQHALLTILTSLCAPGDRIAAESLSYPLLRQLARRLRIQVVPVRTDAGGMSPEALDAACRSAPPGNRIRAVYLMPSCRNPTLTQMSLRRREELVEVCRRRDLLIMEDDVFALTQHRDTPCPEGSNSLPPLAKLAPERACFIAATSEVLGGGLRVAYLCPPQHHLDELERTISYTISMVPPLMAELAARWISDGTAQRVLDAKRAEAGARNAIARDILDGFEPVTRGTGFFCWLRLPEPWTGMRFADAARERGVLVAEGEHFAMSHGVPEHGVRIALGGVKRREDLAAALETLAEILHKGS